MRSLIRRRLPGLGLTGPLSHITRLFTRDSTLGLGTAQSIRRQRNRALVTNGVNLLVFLGIAVVGGLGSVWYMVDRGSRLTTEYSGPWRSWSAAGNPDADPYTRAHIMRAGFMPLTAKRARYYFARTDSDGRRLYSDCEYDLRGTGPGASWWSISAYDVDGRLVHNDAEVYSLSGSSLMRDPAGSFSIRIAEMARPGNWLPVTGSAGLMLMIRVYLSGPADEDADGFELPSIQRIACR